MLLRALLLGAIAAVAVPMVFGGMTGFWGQNWVAWGTIQPVPGSPGLLFSIPVFAGIGFFCWLFLSWSDR